MWKDVGLIGRDSFLKKVLLRVNSRKPFVISGQAGIGKTTILQWAFDKTNALSGEFVIPFFEKLQEIEVVNNANGNTTNGVIWGGKGLGKTNFMHWLVRHRLSAGNRVYVFDPKGKGMNQWPAGATVIGTDSDYDAVKSALKSLISTMRAGVEKVTIILDEINILNYNIKEFSKLWLPFAQEGRQYGYSVWAIGQSKTASSLGIKGRYDLTKCFDIFAEMRWDRRKDKRYISVEGTKDTPPERYVQPIKYDGTNNPHPVVVDRTLPAKAFVSGSLSYGNFAKQIAEQWGISTEKLLLQDIESRLLQQSDNYIFVDEMLKLDIRSITLLKAMKDKTFICGAMRDDRKKEDLNQFLWGVSVLKLGYLSKADNTRLSVKAAVHYGCTVSVAQIALASRGVPGRIHSFVTTGEIPREDVKMRSEKFDLSYFFVLALLCFVLFRYVGRVTEDSAFVLLGGAAMILGVVGRSAMSRGSGK